MVLKTSVLTDELSQTKGTSIDRVPFPFPFVLFFSFALLLPRSSCPSSHSCLSSLVLLPSHCCSFLPCPGAPGELGVRRVSASTACAAPVLCRGPHSGARFPGADRAWRKRWLVHLGGGAEVRARGRRRQSPGKTVWLQLRWRAGWLVVAASPPPRRRRAVAAAAQSPPPTRRARRVRGEGPAQRRI